MRMNLPVTQQEFDYPSENMLVSVTNTQGFITHCNAAFLAVSGYSFDELMGQNHNIVRHPDMPTEAYKDLWHTIGQGRPWSGLVKNRRKNGDFYWVQANITPILENGKPTGYMSVRTKPGRQQIQQAAELYRQMNIERESGRPSFYLQGGQVRYPGLRGVWGQLQRLSLSSRMALALVLLTAASLLPHLLGLEGLTELTLQGSVVVGASGLVMRWFHRNVALGMADARQFADAMAGCNLTTTVAGNYPPPLDGLFRSMRQIQINLQAVVGDVRSTIDSFTHAASEIAAGGLDLSARTESQASSLQQTAASMEQISSNGQHTAQTASQVFMQSKDSNVLATQGGEAVHKVGLAMSAIADSSVQMQEIISVIEGIAFQTNILALNAAVEAARAGDQGRGFAVVASEVRLLAGRSASASKQIRELIARSSEHIASGTQQMGSAASAIDAVVKSVQMTSQLIELISNSADEQSIGIAQVNQAVTHLDSVTQQNAALVEESSAASDSLSDSAINLSRSVQMFHLP
ncbi:MAG: methyl-accepting chemotaxis protein [Rhodoferax sp.]|uniref:methyl-accepting chemotaxis protein n=1 Tax=Rhodoferax sp. TaxID=50421 RepID=UPI003016E922